MHDFCQMLALQAMLICATAIHHIKAGMHLCYWKQSLAKLPLDM